MVKTSSADFLLPEASWLKNLQHAFRLRGLCVTRLSGGHSCRFELRTFLAPNDEQGNPSDEREPAEDWRNGKSVLGLRGDVHWTYIHDVVAMGVVESMVGECESAENDQENSSEDDRFHILRSRD
jgi:hypothetical protein